MAKKMLKDKKEITPEQVKDALKVAISQIEKNLPDYTDKFPACASVDGIYPIGENVNWTTGFWTGCIWLAYENTNRDVFKQSALKQVENFHNRIVNKIDICNHDMGFLYSLSCVSAYKLTGNTVGRNAAVKAADYLISRYVPSGKFIQAWGEIGAPDNQRLIIDCLLNLPLLYWATGETGDEKYQDVANAHITTALKNVIREDNSTYHTYFFNPDGTPSHGATHQGYKDGSAWARGQAWGVYGIALAYRYLPKDEYIELFEKVTDFFIEHLPTNLVPYWDFTFTDGSDEPWDSSAALIAVCGMLEMAKYLPKDKADYYTSMAKKILLANVELCAVTDYSNSNGLLAMGTYGRSSEFNTCKDNGVNECNTWGDYFYMEALTRLLTDWELYW